MRIGPSLFYSMSKPIKLGRKDSSKLPGELAVIASAMGGDEDAGLPRLHIDNHDDPRLLDMPDHGEARIKYSVKHRHHEESDEGGKKKHRYSVSLAVHHIEPPESSKKKDAYGDDLRRSFKNNFK
jgi:hypothetical protein